MHELRVVNDPEHLFISTVLLRVSAKCEGVVVDTHEHFGFCESLGLIKNDSGQEVLEVKLVNAVLRQAQVSFLQLFFFCTFVMAFLLCIGQL